MGHGVTFLVGLVLARLLSPAEYGLIGICTIFTTVLTSIVDSGFSNSLIRKKDVTNDDYNTMFITNMVVSVLLLVLLFFSAPLIARFFDRPELIPLVRVMGLLLIVQALSLVQYTRLTKRIDFRTKTKASLIAAILSGLVGIAMAYIGFGVWSLVGQKLTERTLFTICLWYYNKWVPRLRFSQDSFRYMWGYGWKLMLSSLLDRIWKELYQVVVGKCYSPATLGQYSRSKEYAHLFSTNATTIMQRVTFPVLAEVQDDLERMVSAYRKIIKTTMFITAIGMFFMAAISEPLIYCLIGPKWHEASTYLPFICVSMSLYPLHAINLNMLQVQGRSDLFLYLEIIKKVISVGPLCLGIFVNIYWMLIGSIVTGIISFFLNTYYTGKKLHYSSWAQLKDLITSYTIAVVVALSVFFLKYLPLSPFIILPMQVLVGGLVVLVVCETWRPEEYVGIKKIAKENLSKLTRKT